MKRKIKQNNSFQNSKSVFSKYRRSVGIFLKTHYEKFLIGISTVSVFAIALFFFGDVQGATYTFVQTDWSGGTDGDVVALHPGDETGWDKYNSATNITFSAGSANLTSISSAYSLTDDGTFSNTGSATGGGFGSGSLSSVTQSGSGTEASLSLAIASTVSNTMASGITAVPGNINNGALMIRNGDADDVYVARGGGTEWFHKYSISGNSWTTLASLPLDLTNSGAKIVRYNNEDSIYVMRGGATNSFYKYSISGDSWTTLANLPATVTYGSMLFRVDNSDYIYAMRGNNTTTTWKYSISGNSWAAITGAPGTLGVEAAGAYNSADNSIYIIRGNNAANFYKLDLDDLTWTTLASASHNVYNNLASTGAVAASVVADGTDNVYALLSFVDREWNDVVNFTLEKFNITAGTWSTLSSTVVPASTVFWSDNFKISFVSGEDNLYVFLGANTLNPTWDPDIGYTGGGTTSLFRKYSISGNSWSTLYDYGTVSEQNAGGQLYRQNGTGSIYILRGGGTGFQKYVVSESDYYSSGTFTSAAIDLGQAADMQNISWTSSTPSGVGVSALRFQVATNNDNATWNFVGPDGTSGTYFTSSSGEALPAGIDNTRYLKYKAYLATDNTSYTPTLYDVTITYNGYSASGNIVGSVYDTGNSATVLGPPRWTETLPDSTDIQFQMRSGATTGTLAVADWLGPDGTSGSYFTSSTGGESLPAALSDGSGDRYFQYKAILSTSGSNNPTLSDVTLTYAINERPEVQNVTATQNADGTVTISYEVRDTDTDLGVTPGTILPTFAYWDGSTYVTAVTLDAGATSSKAVGQSSFNSYSATWYPATDYSGYYQTTTIRVTANDSEGANNTGTGTSAVFTLDTKSPTGNSMVIDASQSPAALTLTASDDNAIQMKISVYSNLSGASYVDYNTSATTTLGAASTVYYRFKDAYGNETSIYSAGVLDAPSNVVIQDISNTLASPAQYRLFVAWSTISEPSAGFASYKLYRSLDASNWSLATTTVERTTNYYIDSSVSADTLYYYRLVALDDDGNISKWSSDVDGQNVSGNPNGTQDADEGSGLTVAPTISNVASSVSATYVTITWDTDILSDSTVGYSSVGGNFDTTVSDARMLDSSGSVGSHSVAISGLTPNTTYYYRVTSANVDGVSTSSTLGENGYSFTTDAGTTISNVAVAAAGNNSATIVWNTDESADAYVVYSSSSNLSGSTTTGTAETGTSHSVTVNGLSAGQRYYFYVQSTGGSGVGVDKNIVNGAVAYYYFNTTNDGVGPVISDVSVSPLIATATINWVTGELANSQIDYGTASDTLNMSSDLDSALTIQHSVIISGLSGGTTYYYRVKSRDGNNNLTNSSVYSFNTVDEADATPPVISNVATSSISLTGAVITWDTDENASYLVNYGTSESLGLVAGDASDFSASTFSVILSGLSANTTYYFQVRSEDANGNYSTSSLSSFVTVADTTAPTISNITTSLVSDTSAVITWDTDESVTGVLYYGQDTNYGSSATTSLNTHHSARITGLTKSTGYYYKVVVSDFSSNSATDDNSGDGYSFVTTDAPGTTVVVGGGSGGANADRTPPVISGLTVKDVSKDSAVVYWKTNEKASSLVNYGPTMSYGLLTGDYKESAIEHSVKLFDLIPGANYHFKVVSFDDYGNYIESDDGKFSTLNSDGTEAIEKTDSDNALLNNVKNASAGILTELLGAISSNPFLSNIPEDAFVKAFLEMTDKVVSAPVISGLKPQVKISGTSAVVSWVTDKKSSSAVAFAKNSAYHPGEDFEYSDLVFNPDELSTSHQVVLNHLEPLTTYHYQVRSRGLVGKEAASEDFTFQTGKKGLEINNISIKNISGSKVQVSWQTNIPSQSAIKYTNEKNQKQFSDSNSSYRYTHEYVISNLEGSTGYALVISAVGEQGETAASPPLKFSTIKDDVPPVISNLSADSTVYPGQDSKVQTIISWDTDKPASTRLYYKISGSGIVTEKIGDDGLVNHHLLILTEFSPGTVYNYWVETEDASGNIAKSDIFSILTPKRQQTIVDIIMDNFQQVFGWTNKIGQ